MREPGPMGYWGVTAIDNEHIKLIRRLSSVMVDLADPSHKKYWANDQELICWIRADIETLPINLLYFRIMM